MGKSKPKTLFDLIFFQNSPAELMRVGCRGKENAK